MFQSDEELNALIPKVSNWGRWGENDQLGTLNFLTPTHVMEAARLVRSGRVVSLARETVIKPQENIAGRKIQEYELQKFEEVGFCSDFVGFVFHGFEFTHIDGLCHVFANKKMMYNGYSIDDLENSGANKLGTEHMAKKGITGRGVLLDIGYLKGRDLEPGEIIYLKDLLEAEKKQNIKIKNGDILFVRSGSGRRNKPDLLAGMHPGCIPWLYEKEISVLGNDGGSDYFPNKYKQWVLPLHGILIPHMGMPLIDNAELDSLSQVCQEENRWEFMVSLAPWKIKGTTGSLVNPLAIF